LSTTFYFFIANFYVGMYNSSVRNFYLEVDMRVKLLKFDVDAVERVVEAARVCRQSHREMTDGERAVFVSDLLTKGHLSPFEFTEYTFQIDGISRVASHQLVRHRHLSFQQESQRAVKPGAFYHLPESFSRLKNSQIIDEILTATTAVYEKLIAEGMKKEDARYLLPLATTSSLVVKGSARAWLEYLELRCCMQTQAELRDGSMQILTLLKSLHPVIFNGAGPRCDQCWNRGRCK
jgi:thymidylate synthase (FAD)